MTATPTETAQNALDALDKLPVSDWTWETYHLKGILLGVLDRFSEGEEHLAKAIEMNPKDPILLTDMAENKRHQGLNDEARQLLLTAVTLDPKCGDAVFQLGLLEFESANYSAALRMFDAAATIMPTDSGPLTLKARTLTRLEKDDEAKGVFENALSKNPKDIEAHYYLAQLSIRQGNAAAAISHLEAIIAIDSNHLSALRQLSVAYIETDKFDLALLHIKTLLSADPEDLDTQFRYATCLAGLKRHAEAVATYDQMLARTPDDVIVICAKGLAQLNANDTKSAMLTLKSATVIDPNHYLPYYYLGVGYMKSERWEDAAKALTKALTLGAQSADVASALGTCYLARNQSKEAISAFQKATEFSPQQGYKDLVKLAESRGV